ncbi:MAG TPA: HEPN domain-containing protein [Candidatus Brocadiia bacterium]|nr:HEPN domain-containing protein [Candidatus Brocadiales bacterium]
MNNFEVGRKLLSEAEECWEELQHAFARGSWNVVIRRAQEVVELSLKGLLKMMGMEHPKTHDVGELFQTACKEKKIALDDKLLVEIKEISSRLARKRAPAFYMEKSYNKAEAEEALADGEKVIQLARKLFRILKQGNSMT